MPGMCKGLRMANKTCSPEAHRGGVSWGVSRQLRGWGSICTEEACKRDACQAVVGTELEGAGGNLQRSEVQAVQRRGGERIFPANVTAFLQKL